MKKHKGLILGIILLTSSYLSVKYGIGNDVVTPISVWFLCFAFLSGLISIIMITEYYSESKE